MRSYIENGQYPYGFSDKFWGWMMAWFCISAAALLIAAWPVDSRGAKEWNHPGPVPEGVVMLAPDAYLFTTEARVGPAQVCRGTQGEADAKPVDTEREIDNDDIPGVDEGIFATCDRDQTWNDKREGSMNYGNALLTVGRHPAFMLPVGIWLMLILSWGATVVFLVEKNKRSIARKKAENERKKKRVEYNTMEAEYRAIQSAYATDTINDLEFHQKVEKLIERGYELPDRDIFK
jgi:hypothetical protein